MSRVSLIDRSPVIPYPRNQQKGVKDILRIDRKFKSHGPQELRRAYRKRVSAERVFSRLKPSGLDSTNMRGLAKITFHAQLSLLAILFTAQAAVNAPKTSKSGSIRYLANEFRNKHARSKCCMKILRARFLLHETRLFRLSGMT